VDGGGWGYVELIDAENPLETVGATPPELIESAFIDVDVVIGTFFLFCVSGP